MATRYTELTEQCFDDEYNRINVEYDANLDRAEIYQYLDRQAGGTFDRNIAAQFYDGLKKDEYGRVSFQQFRDIYRDSMMRLDGESNATMTEIARIEGNIRSLENDQAIAKQNYWYTPEGGSGAVAKKKLKVTLHSAEVYPSRDSTESVVISLRVNSSIEAKTVQTKVGTSEVWHNEYEFPITEQDVALQVLMEDAINRGAETYENIIRLQDLADQKQHVQWVELFGVGNRKTPSKVHLTLQYIHDTDELYRGVRDEWQS